MIFNDLTELESAAPEALKNLIPSKLPLRNALLHPRRSALMVSAHQVKHLNKLDELMADMAVINLEDGVAPQEKPRARALAALFVSRARHVKAELVVRVNPLGEGGEADIELINRVKPDAIRIPKIRSIGEVKLACSLINPDIRVHLSIETGQALRELSRLRIEERVDTVYLGVLDLLADLGLPQSVMLPDNPLAHHLLSRFLLDARIAGFHPFSFVFQEYRDLTTFEQWCRWEKNIGFRSKGCISPAQVEIANRIFVPDPAEVERAQAIAQAFETEAAKGNTGFSHETYGFIDEPIYRGALLLLQAAGS